MPSNKKRQAANKSKSNKKPQKTNKKSQAKMQVKNVIPFKSPVDLNNIMEVTQEHQTNRYNTQSIQQASAFIKKNKRSLCQKSFQCIKNIFKCFEKSTTQFSIVVKQQQLLKTIQKLRTQNTKLKPILPPCSQNKKTLVLDIDQTLVFSSQSQLQKHDFSFTMPYKKQQIKVYSKNRFGLQSFLFQMSKIYEIVIYTTNIKDYVDNVLQNIDKRKRIAHVLYKQKCLNLNKIHYLKSLKVLGRDPEKTVFIDHNIASGILQPKNFLQLRPFGGQKHDRQLVKLIPFLRQLALQDSVIPVSKNCEEYFNRQIRLKFNSLQQTKNQDDKQNQFDFKVKKAQTIGTKRRRYHHKKANSEVEQLNKNDQQSQNNSKNQTESISHSQKQTQQSQQTQVSLKQRNLNAL